jgi:hypothetical protein
VKNLESLKNVGFFLADENQCYPIIVPATKTDFLENLGIDQEDKNIQQVEVIEK